MHRMLSTDTSKETMKIKITHKPTGLEFKNVKLLTINMLRKTVTISQEADLDTPWDPTKLTHELSDLIIEINNNNDQTKH